ncbi:hypothetical protein KBA41_12775 [Candidatus Ozemobacteraceae bacterium]|nr:hypothetical protein [Candidatus Ozemobacteraceae bacterium]
MEKQIGVWVDHRKAVIVTIWEEKETVQIVHSSLETTGHPLGVASQYGGQDMQADDTLQRHSATYLKKFYADIASYVKNADSIMLMGPGEAKVELRKNLESRMMGDNIVEVIPADKLTEREVTLKVRAYYAKS